MAKINTKKPTSRKGLPPVEASSNMEVQKPASKETVIINFRVSPAFKVELKTQAAKNGTSMTELLYQMFNDYKASHS